MSFPASPGEEKKSQKHRTAISTIVAENNTQTVAPRICLLTRQFFASAFFAISSLLSKLYIFTAVNAKHFTYYTT